MNKSLIFISHHHSDAEKLGNLKERLEAYDIDAFIAHTDIKPGQHDLNTIKEELEARNIFLLIGSSDAQDSPYVNQEIGFALGQGKSIISTIKADSSPWGFIAHQQAIKYKDIADDAAFFNKLLKEITRFAEDNDYLGKKKKALSILEANDILSNTNHSSIWNLEVVDTWNDRGFKTRCTLKNGSNEVARIRLAHANFPDSSDKDKNQIKDFLPDDNILFNDNILFLDKNFFSRIQFHKNNIPPAQQEAIRCLFNDIETDKEIAKRYAYKTVTEVSLFRNEGSKYSEFLEGINNDQ